MSNIKDQTREFITRHIRTYDLQDDDDIFAMGFVNSMFAMQLIMFLEQTFGISLGDDDMDIENYRSLNAIEALVQRKGGG